MTRDTHPAVGSRFVREESDHGGWIRQMRRMLFVMEGICTHDLCLSNCLLIRFVQGMNKWTLGELGIAEHSAHFEVHLGCISQFT